MSAVVRQSIWFARLVLGAATILLGTVALKLMIHPVESVADHGITLGTPDAVTAMRVSGGIFLAVAIILVACLLAERRLLIGLAVLATIASVILAVRLAGLGIDGPGPFTLRVLKPEVVLVLLSTAAVWLERKRRSQTR
jgi:hypothetical protein